MCFFDTNMQALEYKGKTVADRGHYDNDNENLQSGV